MITIIVWSGGISLAYFLTMRKLKLLRVPLLEEIIGLDAAEMGSSIRIKVSSPGSSTHRKVSLNFHLRDNSVQV